MNGDETKPRIMKSLSSDKSVLSRVDSEPTYTPFSSGCAHACSDLIVIGFVLVIAVVGGIWEHRQKTRQIEIQSNQAYSDGIRARMSGASSESNPYHSGYRKVWLDGWIDAKKKGDK